MPSQANNNSKLSVKIFMQFLIYTNLVPSHFVTLIRVSWRSGCEHRYRRGEARDSIPGPVKSDTVTLSIRPI